MLLSFSATTGIILWSRPIERSVLRFFHYKNKRKDGFVGTVVYYIKRLFKICVNMLSVSVSAFLWILPITAVAFNRISRQSYLFLCYVNRLFRHFWCVLCCVRYFLFARLYHFLHTRLDSFRDYVQRQFCGWCQLFHNSRSAQSKPIRSIGLCG